MTIDKTVRLGTAQTCNGQYYSIFCRIKYDGKRLSITGVEGPTPSGNALGGCGQIVMSLAPKDINPAPGWTRAKIRKFLDTWKRWHLNDMRAGTPEQRKELEKHEFPGYPKSHYEWACEVLDAAGLLTVNGYKYGSAWLHEDLPDDTLAWLSSLPETDKQPAWI